MGNERIGYGDLVRSVIHDEIYRITSLDRKRLTLTNVETNKKARISVSYFLASLDAGRFVPANGLDHAIESCKQARKN